MKRDRQPESRKKNTILLVILALVCVAGAELLACRVFAPGLYQNVTSPVRRGWEAVCAIAHNTVTSASAALSRPEKEPEDSPGFPENQLASNPLFDRDASILDPAVTELKESDGRQVLTGGVVEMVYYNQGDPAWADQPYGSDKLGRYGCGPTAMAMVVNSMAGADSDPAQMASWAREHGYWASRSGSYLSIVEGAADAFGLEASSLDASAPEELRDTLLSGKLIVALLGPGHFTETGHFIILRGVTLSGEVLVADPNSTERSLTAWDPQVILDELSTSTSDGAPLWALGAVDSIAS